RNSPTCTTDPATLIALAIQQLSETSLACLIGSDSTSDPQHNTRNLIATTATSHSNALSITPMNDAEAALLVALRESKAEAAHLRRRTLELQATNILNEAYCKTLREQLAFKEKGGGSRKRGKLMGDGLPVLLSGDAFFDRVVEAEILHKRQEQAVVARREARVGIQGAIDEWKKLTEERRTEVAARHAQYHADMEVWEAGKVSAKLAKKRFGQLKPKLGKLPPTIPRPKVPKDVVEGSEEEIEMDDEDEDEQSDSDA
ncbi:hypothetical protein BOTBODRAFT_103124, partial [Botryobasidium botryosum FD-172 SS1]